VKCDGEGTMEKDGSVLTELTEGLSISCQDHSVLSLNQDTVRRYHKAKRMVAAGFTVWLDAGWPQGSDEFDMF
jgi:hypothetical protein